MKSSLQRMTVSIVLSLWLVEMPQAWAKCWTVSGVEFCDNRESTGNNGGRGSEDGPRGPTPAQIQALAARERRAKANVFNDEGVAAWNRGEWGIAREQFQQAHSWNPDSKAIFTNLVNATHKVGLAAMEEGDWERAADTFKSALYHKPDSLEFKRLSAAAEEKRRAVRQAYELDLRGIKAAENGDWTTALAYFQKAAQNDPGKPAYANHLAIARQKTVSYEQNEQGRAAARNGDWASALKYFQQAAQTDPGEPAYTGNIALAQRNVQEQQNKAVVARVQQGVSAIAEEVKNSQPVGDLKLSDLSATEDAFGTKKSNPTLTPAETQKKTGSETDPGKQLKSAERHAGETPSQDIGSASQTAQKGFDTLGSESGGLVYPDMNNHRQVPPSALDKQIPQSAKDDPQIKKMQAWYRSLDAKKAEKEQMITEIKEQQKTNKDPLLEIKITTLANDVKRFSDDQTKATETVKERVEEIKKEMLDKGLAWDEEPTTDNPSAK